jgi:Bacterial archaeo-eukaryotic release factor family 2
MANLTALRDLLSHEGSFASVHLDASHDTQDAAKVTELRWRAAHDQLAALDASRKTMRVLEEAIHEAPPPVGRAGRLLVAAGDTVRVDEYLAEPPAQPMVRVSPLPYLLPLADWRESDVPHVAVAVDQTGADLLAVDATGTAITEEVDGRYRPVHKVRGGGWAHLTIQRRVEEAVRRNVTDVAAEVAVLAGKVGARLVVVAGEPQTRSQLRAALPENWRRLVTEIDHGRSEDPSHHTVDRAITDLLDARRRAELDEVLARFRAAGGAPGLAVAGLADTTGALREGNVEILLVDATAVADRTVWTASDPTMVATSRQALHELGVSDRGEIRADEALPAAAIASGAEVVAAFGETALELASGVGAILRHR